MRVGESADDPRAFYLREGNDLGAKTVWESGGDRDDARRREGKMNELTCPWNSKCGRVTWSENV